MFHGNLPIRVIGSLPEFTDNGVFLSRLGMWTYPEIDPVLVSFGPLAIRWYALSYLVGFALVWWVLKRRASSSCMNWKGDELSDLLFIYGVLGVIIGDVKTAGWPITDIFAKGFRHPPPAAHALDD